MTAPAAATILDAIADPVLFGRWFRDPTTWRPWFSFLRVLFGLELSEDDLALFEQCTGRKEARLGGYFEAWLIVGRRGGKSLVLALIAVFLAAFRDWSPYLTPGERGTIMVIAADRKQARVIFRYITAMLKLPMLAAMVERSTADTIDLAEGITIEIQTASWRSTRGYTIIACLADEIAFWRSDESANPDTEILAAIRPAMATIPGGMLLVASSPYAKRGAQWQAFRQHYGKPSSVLVWKAPTRTMNATIPQAVIDEAMDADPANAQAEYMAEFRSDIAAFIDREAVEAVTVPERRELAPAGGMRYVGFVDPSGGASDSMTLAVAHFDHAAKRAVLDALRERRPPFSPDDVVAEFAELLKAYSISTVQGDRYGGEWPRERFRNCGITYDPAVKPKSDLYRDLLPLLNSGHAELLDNPRLQAQLVGLERRTARSGRDSIDHAPGAHDDLANVAAGALTLAAETGHSSFSRIFAAMSDDVAPLFSPAAPDQERAVA